MPIHQDRMKSLLDAAIQREEDFTYLHRAIESILERNLPPQEAITEIAVELRLRRALMKPDAIIAQELMHYNLTHKDNARKRANMIKLREQQRAMGALNTKPRTSRYTYHKPMYEQLAREGNEDIPDTIKLSDHPETPAPDFSTPVPLHPDILQHQEEEERKKARESKLNQIELPKEEEDDGQQ